MSTTEYVRAFKTERCSPETFSLPSVIATVLASRKPASENDKQLLFVRGCLCGNLIGYFQHISILSIRLELSASYLSEVVHRRIKILYEVRSQQPCDELDIINNNKIRTKPTTTATTTTRSEQNQRPKQQHQQQRPDNFMNFRSFHYISLHLAIKNRVVKRSAKKVIVSKGEGEQW